MAEVFRKLTKAAVFVLAILVGLAISIYVQASVPRLRQTITYRPYGSATKRVAGLSAAENLGLRDVPESLLLALLFREDKNFFEHHGFDFEEVRNSVRDYVLEERRLRGASTLSQQLARSLFLTNERTLRRKVLEAIYTLKLERNFSKQEILVLYLNNIEWGSNVYGLRAAARHYFGKPPSQLAPVESVFLVSVIPNPKALSKRSADGRLPPSTEASMQNLLAVLASVNVDSRTEPRSEARRVSVQPWKHARALQLQASLRRAMGATVAASPGVPAR